MFQMVPQMVKSQYGIQEQYILTGNTSIRKGQNADFNNNKDNSIEIGPNSGRNDNGIESIAIGLGSERTHQSQNAISIGTNSGGSTQGQNAISIGTNSGQLNQKDWSIAIGNQAGNDNQKNKSIAIGAGSGFFNQGTNSVALGLYLGQFNQGENCIDIGPQSGITSQTNSSILINAGNSALNRTTQNACYIQPIRNVITGGNTTNILCYNTSDKEVVQASNIEFVNPITIPVGSLANCEIQFQNDPNTGIISNGSDQLSLVCGEGARFIISGLRFTVTPQIRASSVSISAPIYSFSNDLDTEIFNPSANVLEVSCGNSLVAQFEVSGITFSQNLFLPTSVGTSSMKKQLRQ